MILKSNIERIELEYDEFYTQINELNRISELPDAMSFKVSLVAQFLLVIMIIGVGLIGGIYSISSGKKIGGTIIIVGSIVIYFILYFISHRDRNKKYVVGKEGIIVDDVVYNWDKIDDLHLTIEKLNRRRLYRICFTYDGEKKEFSLDSMTKSIGEIKQILYMYQRWWIHHSTNML